MIARVRVATVGRDQGLPQFAALERELNEATSTVKESRPGPVQGGEEKLESIQTKEAEPVADAPPGGEDE